MKKESTCLLNTTASFQNHSCGGQSPQCSVNLSPVFLDSSKHFQLLFLWRPSILAGFTWPTFSTHQHGCIASRWHPRFIGPLLSAGQWVWSAFSSPSLRVLSKHSQCIATRRAKPAWMLSNSHMEQQSIMGREMGYERLEWMPLWIIPKSTNIIKHKCYTFITLSDVLLTYSKGVLNTIL